MKKEISIYWIRQDLRLNDNPALYEFVKNGAIVPVYILDDINAGEHQLGSASRVWLHCSLEMLNKDLQNKIIFFKGDPLKILTHLCETENINKIYWNRVYEPWGIKRDKKIKNL